MNHLSSIKWIEQWFEHSPTPMIFYVNREPYLLFRFYRFAFYTHCILYDIRYRTFFWHTLIQGEIDRSTFYRARRYHSYYAMVCRIKVPFTKTSFEEEEEEEEES